MVRYIGARAMSLACDRRACNSGSDSVVGWQMQLHLLTPCGMPALRKLRPARMCASFRQPCQVRPATTKTLILLFGVRAPGPVFCIWPVLRCVPCWPIASQGLNHACHWMHGLPGILRSDPCSHALTHPDFASASCSEPCRQQPACLLS